MTIQFTCPNCLTAISVTEDKIGTQGKCIKCQAIITVPTPQTFTPITAPPPAPRSKTSTGIKILIGCGIIILLILLIPAALIAFIIINPGGMANMWRDAIGI